MATIEAPQAQAQAKGGGLAVAGLSVGFVLMWSSGFVGGRLGTQSASTLTLMSWRFLAILPVAVLLLAFLARREGGLSPRRWPRQAVVGLGSQVLYLGGVVGAIELGVSAGTSAIVAALQPLVTGALSGIALGSRTSRREWRGLAVGFAGVALAVGGDLAGGSAPAWAYALPFVGMLGLVAATLVEARDPEPIPVVEGLAVQCATSAVAFTLLAAAAGRLADPVVAEPAFWGAVAWLIAFSTLGGYGFYWLTMRRAGATRLSSLVYLT
ncbi:DMT family transporter, partial [Alcanivoracaceae bacterium MT1]